MFRSRIVGFSSVRRPGDDPCGYRPPRSSLHNPGDECRKLSPSRSHRAKARARKATSLRHTKHSRESKLIDVPRQSKRLPTRRTPAMIISHGRLVSSRLSRRSHPDCRATGWLDLLRGGLSPPILCQLPGALRSGSKAEALITSTTCLAGGRCI